MFLTEKMNKEIFPYEYYTKTLYLNKIGNINEAMKYINNNTIGDFTTSIKNGKAYIDSETFDM